MEKLINGETHQRSQATQEVMQLEVHECGAHQTNQESSDPRGYATRSIHSLQSMPSSCEISFQSMAQDCMGWVIVIIHMSKAQITPNDVADATSVCSRDFLKSRYSVWEMKIAQSDGSVGPLMLQMSSMSLKSSEFRKSTEFFKVLRVSDSNQVTCENETQDTG